MNNKITAINNMMDIIIKKYGFESKTTIMFCTIAESGDFIKTYKLFILLTNNN